MRPMIAYCGLVCSNCPTFLATQNDDDRARDRTAALYAEKFGLSLAPEAINCDGCLSEGGKQIGYCRTCEIRKCAAAKAVVNCAACDEQPCEMLKTFHAFSPDGEPNFSTPIIRS